MVVAVRVGWAHGTSTGMAEIVEISWEKGADKCLKTDGIQLTRRFAWGSNWQTICVGLVGSNAIDWGTSQLSLGSWIFGLGVRIYEEAKLQDSSLAIGMFGLNAVSYYSYVQTYYFDYFNTSLSQVVNGQTSHIQNIARSTIGRRCTPGWRYAWLMAITRGAPLLISMLVPYNDPPDGDVSEKQLLDALDTGSMQSARLVIGASYQIYNIQLSPPAGVDLLDSIFCIWRLPDKPYAISAVGAAKWA